MTQSYLLWLVTSVEYVKRQLTMTKNLQYRVTFVTRGYILNVTIKFFLIFNISMATIMTPGFALNAPVKHFLLEISTMKIFIRSFNSEVNESSVGKHSNDNSILKCNPPPNLKLLFNQFNELTAKSNKKNSESSTNCRNLDIDEIQKMKVEPNSFSLFRINSCSLNKNFEDLKYLLKATNKTFDVIAISESRFLSDSNLSKNINIYN